MTEGEKRTYHPLVIFLYFSGALDKKYIKQIPPTTIQYWKSLDHTTMFGFEWVEKTCDNIYKQEFTTKKKVIKQSVRICSRILKTFSTMYPEKQYKKTARKYSAVIVRTIDTITPQIDLDIACKILKISNQQYYRWKNKLNCTASILNLCFKVHPSQLSLEECCTIESAVKNPKNDGKPLSTIYYTLLRKGMLYCSLSSFYKYASLYAISREFRKIQFREPTYFRASYPFEYLHIDTTKVFTQSEGWQRVVFVKDNYSKTLLYKEVAPSAGSIHIKDIIKKTFTMYDLYSSTTPINIVCDNGTENKGEVTKWLNSKQNKRVMRIIAKKDNDFSNNMVESANNQFKNIFLKNKPLPRTNEELRKYLDEFEIYTNTEWVPGEFHGLTPIEVLNGEIPDKYRYTKDIKTAKQQRIMNNRNIGLEICKECIGIANAKKNTTSIGYTNSIYYN